MLQLISWLQVVGDDMKERCRRHPWRPETANLPGLVWFGTHRNRRLGDFPQMMIKRQEKSARVSLCATSDDSPGCGQTSGPLTGSIPEPAHNEDYLRFRDTFRVERDASARTCNFPERRFSGPIYQRAPRISATALRSSFVVRSNDRHAP